MEEEEEEEKLNNDVVVKDDDKEDDKTTTIQDQAVMIICEALKNVHDSALLRHELAYILGQMQNPLAITTLMEILKNTSDDSMVRHEAAEALGALGNLIEKEKEEKEKEKEKNHNKNNSISVNNNNNNNNNNDNSLNNKRTTTTIVYDILEEFMMDPAVEVSDTCKLAIELLKWQKTNHIQSNTGKDLGDMNLYHEMDNHHTNNNTNNTNNTNNNNSTTNLDKNPYLSVDPTPAEDSSMTSIQELQHQLQDQELLLFKRYRAMFSLRNRGTEEAVLALCAGLRNEEEKNALFRHEVAYVLGQIQHIASVDTLCEVLSDQEEHRMVRHEAAEALGSIGGEKAVTVLKNHLNDNELCVKESCIVALDTMDYWATSF